MKSELEEAFQAWLAGIDYRVEWYNERQTQALREAFFAGAQAHEESAQKLVDKLEL